MHKSTIPVHIKGRKFNALIDSGSTDNFIHPFLVNELSLPVTAFDSQVSMASSSHVNNISGFIRTDIHIDKATYKNLKLNVLENLCVDIILGLDFQTQHECVKFNFGGSKPTIEVCGLAALNVEPPEVFANLSPDCKPIATKSRKYSSHDKKFIESETQKLLAEGIIEPSRSPWRAQVVVTKDDNHKKRLVIDYSQTINKYTHLDAYPLPRIDEFVNNIAQYQIFSSIDLKSAYHQIPLKDRDKIYTAFEANGGLYQFTRMPFGITNGVSCFQRGINDFITMKNIPDTFAYLDNIYVCGLDQSQHDKKLNVFLEAAKSNNWTFNTNKCEFSTSKLSILGSLVKMALLSQIRNVYVHSKIYHHHKPRSHSKESSVYSHIIPNGFLSFPIKLHH